MTKKISKFRELLENSGRPRNPVSVPSSFETLTGITEFAISLP